MTRCHICSTDTVDAHEPTLCAACCDDRAWREAVKKDLGGES